MAGRSDRAPAALAQDSGRAGRADRSTDFLAAERGVPDGEPPGGGACVQPGHGAACTAGGELGGSALGLVQGGRPDSDAGVLTSTPSSRIKRKCQSWKW